MCKSYVVEKQGVGLVTYPSGGVQVVSHGDVHVGVGGRRPAQQHSLHRHVLRRRQAQRRTQLYFIIGQQMPRACAVAVAA